MLEHVITVMSFAATSLLHSLTIKLRASCSSRSRIKYFLCFGLVRREAFWSTGPEGRC